VAWKEEEGGARANEWRRLLDLLARGGRKEASSLQPLWSRRWALSIYTHTSLASAFDPFFSPRLISAHLAPPFSGGKSRRRRRRRRAPRKRGRTCGVRAGIIMVEEWATRSVCRAQSAAHELPPLIGCVFVDNTIWQQRHFCIHSLRAILQAPNTQRRPPDDSFISPLQRNRPQWRQQRQWQPASQLDMVLI